MIYETDTDKCAEHDEPLTRVCMTCMYKGGFGQGRLDERSALHARVAELDAEVDRLSGLLDASSAEAHIKNLVIRSRGAEIAADTWRAHAASYEQQARDALNHLRRLEVAMETIASRTHRPDCGCCPKDAEIALEALNAVSSEACSSSPPGKPR